MGKLQVTLEFECGDNGQLLYGDMAEPVNVYNEDGTFIGMIQSWFHPDPKRKYHGWVNAGQQSGFIGKETRTVFEMVDVIIAEHKARTQQEK